MQTNRTLITKITIPLYIREVKLSNKQKEKYYEWNGVTIKCGSKKLLQKYINPAYKIDIINNNGNILPQHLKTKFSIQGFYKNKIVSQMVTDKNEWKESNKAPQATKYILCEEIKYSQYEKVKANETQAGKPKIQVINGQNIYNHTASPFTTGKIFDTIKEMYYNKFITIPHKIRSRVKDVLDKSYPLQIEVEIFDTVKNFYDNTKEGNGRIWDVGNRADPYMKTFLDFFSKGYKDKNGNYLLKPFIKEDDRLHVTSGNNAYFTPISEEENRKLVFHIYSDNRPIFKQYLENENNI